MAVVSLRRLLFNSGPQVLVLLIFTMSKSSQTSLPTKDMDSGRENVRNAYTAKGFNDNDVPNSIIPENQNYIAVFPSAYNITKGASFELMISTVANSAKIEIKTVAVSSTIMVYKGRGYRYNLSIRDHYLGQFDKVQRKAVVVQSDKPVAVQGHIEESGTTGGYSLLPVNKKHNRFIVSTFTGNGKKHPSDIILAAVNDDTRVILLYPNGSSTNVTLPSFGTYSVKSKNDLTGTLVTANAPIAVYSGHVCGNVPSGVNYCDRMIENIPPVQYSGRRYIIPPIGGREENTGYIVRVLFPNGKEFSVDGRKYTDGYTQVNMTKNRAHEITCMNECFVYQYNKGHNAGSTSSDPFMMRVLPLNQYASRFVWMTPRLTHLSKGDSYRQYISIIARTEDTAEIALDGKILNSSFWSLIRQTRFSSAFVRVNDGCHNVTHLKGAKIAAYAYGHGTSSSVSYGFPAWPVDFFEIISDLSLPDEPERTNNLTTLTATKSLECTS